MRFVLITLLLLLAAPALAQPSSCGSGAEWRDKLYRSHGEDLRFTLFTDSTTVYLIFANQDTGTWTVLRAYPKKGQDRGETVHACYVSSGKQFWSEGFGY